MKGTNINNLGKQEKNKNVKEGVCIFPFNYKKNVYSECAETAKGKICATSVTDRNTLKTYGYCIPKSSLKKLKVSSTRKTIKQLVPDEPPILYYCRDVTMYYSGTE